MIRRNGPQTWKNLHVTEQTQLDDLIDVDNSVAGGPQPRGFELLKQTARDLDQLIKDAKQQGKKIRALGSAWALTDIAITDGWLVNTKLLNGLFEISDRYFENSYPAAKRPYLVLAQCGISIGELNVYLETGNSGFGRALKTSGIGAGQSLAGAISGNTHGSAINFGATPDFLVGLQIVTGNGQSVWIERESQHVLNNEFVTKLDAKRIRNDDVFNAAIVSFGAFGIITALAVETHPLYQLEFPPINDITHVDLKNKLNNFDFNDPPGLYHYEFIWNPWSKDHKAMEGVATKVPFETGHPGPDPVWIVRNDAGFSLGTRTAVGFLGFPLLTAGQKARAQFKQYRRCCLLGDVRATPGQLFTATVTYFEGYTETAVGVSINDAATMIDVSTQIIQQMKLPAMSQVRLVQAGQSLLGFTNLQPKTAVFEFGLVNDSKFPVFEDNLSNALTAVGVKHTYHWSKNSGIDPARLSAMYDATRIQKWRDARKQVFENDAALMQVFDNAHLARAGLT